MSRQNEQVLAVCLICNGRGYVPEAVEVQSGAERLRHRGHPYTYIGLQLGVCPNCSGDGQRWFNKSDFSQPDGALNTDGGRYGP